MEKFTKINEAQETTTNCVDMTSILAIIAKNTKFCMSEVNKRVEIANNEAKALSGKKEETKALPSGQQKQPQGTKQIQQTQGTEQKSITGQQKPPQQPQTKPQVNKPQPTQGTDKTST